MVPNLIGVADWIPCALCLLVNFEALKAVEPTPDSVAVLKLGLCPIDLTTRGFAELLAFCPFAITQNPAASNTSTDFFMTFRGFYC